MPLALLVVVGFITGIMVGAAAVHLLSEERLMELNGFLEVSLAGLASAPPDHRLIAQKALGQNVGYMLLIGFLGLTPIGLPLVLMLVGLRGFMLGFTVGFLVTERQAAGILLSCLTLLPQNFFYVPALVIAATVASAFSLQLMRGRPSAFYLGMGLQLLDYLVVQMLAVTLTGIGGLVEGYLTPALLRGVGSTVIR